MYLIDSSVWILLFRKHRPLFIESVVDLDEVVTCLPVVQEVLQGFHDESAFRVAHEAMWSFPIVESPLTADVFRSAIALYRSGRRAGLTIRSGVDCLIAACALAHNLIVIHKDRDFDLIAKVSELQVRKF